MVCEEKYPLANALWSIYSISCFTLQRQLSLPSLFPSPPPSPRNARFNLPFLFFLRFPLSTLFLFLLPFLFPLSSSSPLSSPSSSSPLPPPPPLFLPEILRRVSVLDSPIAFCWEGVSPFSAVWTWRNKSRRGAGLTQARPLTRRR